MMKIEFWVSFIYQRGKRKILHKNKILLNPLVQSSNEEICSYIKEKTGKTPYRYIVESRTYGDDYFRLYFYSPEPGPPYHQG